MALSVALLCFLSRLLLSNGGISSHLSQHTGPPAIQQYLLSCKVYVAIYASWTSNELRSMTVVPDYSKMFNYGSRRPWTWCLYFKAQPFVQTLYLAASYNSVV